MDDGGPVFENRKVAEGINSPKAGFVREFFSLAAGLGIAGLAIFLTIYAAGRFFGTYIPYSYEKVLYSEGDIWDGKPASMELQNLADYMLELNGLKEQYPVNVFVADLPMVNAFATFGGRIYFTKMLLAEMTKDEVIFVMAHELAHIVHRDPIRQSGGSITISITLTLLPFDIGPVRSVINSLLALENLRYSRAHETRADEFALKTVAMLGCSPESISRAFLVLGQHDGYDLPSILSTHPDTGARIDHLIRLSRNLDFNPKPHELCDSQKRFRP